MIHCAQKVTAISEQVAHSRMKTKEAMSMPLRFESLHLPFPASSVLM